MLCCINLSANFELNSRSGGSFICKRCLLHFHEEEHPLKARKNNIHEGTLSERSGSLETTHCVTLLFKAAGHHNALLLLQSVHRHPSATSVTLHLTQIPLMSGGQEALLVGCSAAEVKHSVPIPPETISRSCGFRLQA